jgi:uncharacterized delta-60 repeat protein
MQHTLKLAAPSAAIALAGLVAFSIPASGRANPRDDVPAGGLDQRFGYAGIASTPLSSVTADRFLAVTVGEDGQTYAAGFVTLGTDQAIATDQAMAVARIAPDGSLDQSFDGDGIGIVNVAVDGKTAEIARGLVVQSTGKVVVGGQMEHDPTATGDAAMDTDIALSRFGPDGTLDPTFGEGGTARFDLSSGVVLPPTPPSTTSGFRGDTMWGVTTLADVAVLEGPPRSRRPATPIRAPPPHRRWRPRKALPRRAGSRELANQTFANPAPHGAREVPGLPVRLCACLRMRSRWGS